jgi:hypothetical protein
MSAVPRSAWLDDNAPDQARFAFDGDFARTAADLAVGSKLLGRNTRVDQHLETLATDRALDGLGYFHGLHLLFLHRAWVNAKGHAQFFGPPARLFPAVGRNHYSVVDFRQHGSQRLRGFLWKGGFKSLAELESIHHPIPTLTPRRPDDNSAASSPSDRAAEEIRANRCQWLRLSLAPQRDFGSGA